MEIALVVGTVIINQFAVALFQAVFAHTLVANTVLVLLLYIDEVGLFLLHHGCFDLGLDGWEAGGDGVGVGGELDERVACGGGGVGGCCLVLRDFGGLVVAEVLAR